MQNKTLRTIYSARTEKLTFTLQQFDARGLRLYYGANAPTLPNGMIGVPANPKPTECAFLVVFVDGANHFAFYAPRAEIYRADDLAAEDTESLAGMPLGVTPMAYGSNSWTYAVTPLGGGMSANGATAGTPGVWTPSGAAAPTGLAALRASEILASPSAAWTAEQYVVLGDTTRAYWDGDSWEPRSSS